jgi:hypothetical protein
MLTAKAVIIVRAIVIISCQIDPTNQNVNCDNKEIKPIVKVEANKMIVVF